MKTHDLTGLNPTKRDSLEAFRKRSAFALTSTGRQERIGSVASAFLSLLFQGWASTGCFAAPFVNQLA
jgi:hypothetical protein